MPRPGPYKRIELLGVPHYVQGGGDGLCLYYSLCMVAATMFPRLRAGMMETPDWRGGEDAGVLLAYAKVLGASKAEMKKRLAEWFLRGMKMATGEKILNAIAEQELPRKSKKPLFRRGTMALMTRSKHRGRPRKQKRPNLKFADLSRLLREGPIIVAGGDTGELAHHAVVVVGFEKGGADASKRFLLHDPARRDPGWQDLKSFCSTRGGGDPVEVLYFDEWPTACPMPDLLSTDQDETILSRVVGKSEVVYRTGQEPS